MAKTRAVKVLLCHNHPGGVLKPSINDIGLTKVIGAILGSINISLQDHIIVCDNKAISLREIGIIC